MVTFWRAGCVLACRAGSAPFVALLLLAEMQGTGLLVTRFDMALAC